MKPPLKLNASLIVPDEEMVGPGYKIDPFLLNYNYTPMEKSLRVAALERMKGAKGRDLFVAQATAAPEKVMARFFQQMAEMMANYHTKVQATDIVNIESEIWLVNRMGVLVGTYPLDYLAWTSDASTIPGSWKRAPKSRRGNSGSKAVLPPRRARGLSPAAAR